MRCAPRRGEVPGPLGESEGPRLRPASSLEPPTRGGRAAGPGYLTVFTSPASWALEAMWAQTRASRLRRREGHLAGRAHPRCAPAVGEEFCSDPTHRPSPSSPPTPPPASRAGAAGATPAAMFPPPARSLPPPPSPP